MFSSSRRMLRKNDRFARKILRKTTNKAFFHEMLIGLRLRQGFDIREFVDVYNARQYTFTSRLCSRYIEAEFVATCERTGNSVLLEYYHNIPFFLVDWFMSIVEKKLFNFIKLEGKLFKIEEGDAGQCPNLAEENKK